MGTTINTNMGKKKTRAPPAEPEITEEDRQPGVVYVGHVPHGFYEDELRQYFSQFGRVLNVKLSRSKKTGNSKGYAFIKFQYAAVAKTVAETCHNYLFFNKLLKCEYKPASEVHEDTFFQFKWRPNNKAKRQHNAPKTPAKVRSLAARASVRQRAKLAKLAELGVDISLDDVCTTVKPLAAVPELSKKEPKAKSKGKDPEEASINKTSSEVNDSDEAPKPKSPKVKGKPKDTNEASTTKRGLKRKLVDAPTSKPKKKLVRAKK